jgi:hypothetical protein
MRIYIAVYFVLVIGALFALWQADILSRIPFVWMAIGLIVVVGLGIMLFVTSTPPSAPPSNT